MPCVATYLTMKYVKGQGMLPMEMACHKDLACQISMFYHYNTSKELSQVKVFMTDGRMSFNVPCFRYSAGDNNNTKIQCRYCKQYVHLCTRWTQSCLEGLQFSTKKIIHFKSEIYYQYKRSSHKLLPFTWCLIFALKKSIATCQDNITSQGYNWSKAIVKTDK